MESTLLSVNTSALSILLLSKSLASSSTPLVARFQRCLFSTRPSQLTHLQLSYCGELSRLGTGSLARGLGSVDLRGSRLQSAASSSASFTSGGGRFGGIDGNAGGGGGGGGGGGDGKAEDRYSQPSAVPAGASDASALSSDVIILDVGGMTCGGCAASVKRILESQVPVSSANVNLTTETAIVWPVSDAKVAPNWQKDLGEALAKHLTSCGFTSNLRDQGAIDEDIQL